MKSWPIILLVSLLIACSTDRVYQPTQTDTASIPPPESIKLLDLGKAPELTNEVWLNTEQPLRLADLRGQVVLLDMWTFG